MKQNRIVSFFKNQNKTELNYVVNFPFDEMFITLRSNLSNNDIISAFRMTFFGLK